jgi:hypothetical protein
MRADQLSERRTVSRSGAFEERSIHGGHVYGMTEFQRTKFTQTAGCTLGTAI